MRTALQQAFARLEELHPSLFDIHTENGRAFVNEFSKFLEVEREQIMDAMDWIMNKYFEFHEQPTTSAREQYYNENFKSEQCK
jgi:hypothetical protein